MTATEFILNQPRLFIESHPHTEYVIVGCGASVEYVKEVDFAAKREEVRLLNVFAHVGYELPTIDYYARGVRFFPDPQNNDAVVVFSRSCVAVVSRGELLRGGTICSERVVEFGKDIRDVAIVGQHSLAVLCEKGVSVHSMRVEKGRLTVKLLSFTPHTEQRSCERGCLVVQPTARCTFSCLAVFASHPQTIFTRFVDAKPQFAKKLCDEDEKTTRVEWLRACLVGDSISVHCGQLVPMPASLTHLSASLTHNVEFLLTIDGVTYFSMTAKYRIPIDDDPGVDVYYPSFKCLIDTRKGDFDGNGRLSRVLDVVPTAIDEHGNHFYAIAGRVSCEVACARDEGLDSGRGGGEQLAALLDSAHTVTALHCVRDGRQLLIGCASGAVLAVDSGAFMDDARSSGDNMFDGSPRHVNVFLQQPCLDWIRFDSPDRVVVASLEKRFIHVLNLTDISESEEFDMSSHDQFSDISHSPRHGYVVTMNGSDSFLTFSHDRESRQLHTQSRRLRVPDAAKVVGVFPIGDDWLMQAASGEMYLHLLHEGKVRVKDVTPKEWDRRLVTAALRVAEPTATGMRHLILLVDHCITHMFYDPKGCADARVFCDFARDTAAVCVSGTVLTGVSGSGVVVRERLREWIAPRVDSEQFPLWSGGCQWRTVLALHCVVRRGEERTLLVVHGNPALLYDLELWDVAAGCRVGAIRLPIGMARADLFSHHLIADDDDHFIRLALASKNPSPFDNGRCVVTVRRLPWVEVSIEPSLLFPHAGVQDLGDYSSPYRASISPHIVRVSKPDEPLRTHLVLPVVCTVGDEEEEGGEGVEAACVCVAAGGRAGDGVRALFYSSPRRPRHLVCVQFRELGATGMQLVSATVKTLSSEVRLIERNRRHDGSCLVVTAAGVFLLLSSSVPGWSELPLCPHPMVRACPAMTRGRTHNTHPFAVCLDERGRTWLFSMPDKRPKWQRLPGLASHGRASCVETRDELRADEADQLPLVYVGEESGRVHVVSLQPARLVASIPYHHAPIKAMCGLGEELVCVVDVSAPVVVIHGRRKHRDQYGVMVRIALGCPTVDARFAFFFDGDGTRILAGTRDGGTCLARMCECDYDKIAEGIVRIARANAKHRK